MCALLCFSVSSVSHMMQWKCVRKLAQQPSPLSRPIIAAASSSGPPPQPPQGGGRKKKRKATATRRKKAIAYNKECVLYATEKGYVDTAKEFEGVVTTCRKKRAGNTKRKKKELRGMMEYGTTSPKRTKLETEFGCTVRPPIRVPCPTTGLVVGICSCEICLQPIDKDI